MEADRSSTAGVVKHGGTGGGGIGLELHATELRAAQQTLQRVEAQGTGCSNTPRYDCAMYCY